MPSGSPGPDHHPRKNSIHHHEGTAAHTRGVRCDSEYDWQSETAEATNHTDQPTYRTHIARISIGQTAIDAGPAYAHGDANDKD